MLPAFYPSFSNDDIQITCAFLQKNKPMWVSNQCILTLIYGQGKENLATQADQLLMVKRNERGREG